MLPQANAAPQAGPPGARTASCSTMRDSSFEGDEGPEERDEHQHPQLQAHQPTGGDMPHFVDKKHRYERDYGRQRAKSAVAHAHWPQTAS